jgi:hypothetical protein
MTLRELHWMARGREGLEGDVALFIVGAVVTGIYLPSSMPTRNPFRDDSANDEVMRAHRAKVGALAFPGAAESLMQKIEANQQTEWDRWWAEQRKRA